MFSSKSFTVAAATFALIAPAVALYDASSPANLALYWGSGPFQTNLSYYCEQSTVDIIPLAFMNVFPAQGDGYPAENFGNACYGAPIFTPGPGYPLGDVDTAKDQLYVQCPGIQEGIPYCQSLGKKILLSLGGASNTYQLTGTADGEYFADFLWGSYGPFKQSWLDAGGIRPMDGGYYGTDSSIHIDIDGFDFDIEFASTDSSEGYIAMINRLREHFTENPSKRYFISGAPQCPLPDPNMGAMIAGAQFDLLWIQFYNNDWAQCTARQWADNYVLTGQEDSASFTYDSWVSTINSGASAGASIYLGLLGSSLAGTATDYISPLEAQSLIESYHDKPQFGGVMIWEATYSEENDDAELNGQSYHEFVKSCLASYAPPPPTSTSSVVSSTTISSSSSSSTALITSSVPTSIESSAAASSTLVFISSSAAASSTFSEVSITPSPTFTYVSETSAAASSLSLESSAAQSSTSLEILTSESAVPSSTLSDISTSSSSVLTLTSESSAASSSASELTVSPSTFSKSVSSPTIISSGYSIPGNSHNATSKSTHSSKPAASGTAPVHSSKPTDSYTFTGYSSKSTSIATGYSSKSHSSKPSSGYTIPAQSSNSTVIGSTHSTKPYSTKSVVTGTGESSKPYPTKSSIAGTGESSKPYPTKSSVVGTGQSSKPYSVKPSGTGVGSCRRKTKTKTKTSSSGPSGYPGSETSVVISSTAPYGNSTYSHSRTKSASSPTSSAEGVTVSSGSATETRSSATGSSATGSSATGSSASGSSASGSSASASSTASITSSSITSGSSSGSSSSIVSESSVVGSSTIGASETSSGSITKSGSVSSETGSITSVVQYTTSTAYVTTVYTITSCAATVTDCPARIGSVTTETISSYTTVCPVSATSTSSAEGVSVSSKSSSAQGVTATQIPSSSAQGVTTSPITSAIQYTTSTAYVTTVYTITSCAATVTDCPGRIGSVTTETIFSYTTVCPVTETSGNSGIVSSTSSPVVAPTPTTAIVSYGTSTVYQTSVYTITSCAPSVTDCPARSGQLTTETISSYTSVYPITLTSILTNVPTSGISSAAGIETSIPIGASSAAGLSSPAASEASTPPNLYTTQTPTLINSQTTTISAVIALSTITVVPVPIQTYTSIAPPYSSGNGTVIATGSSISYVPKPSSYVVKTEGESTKSATVSTVASPTAVTFEGGAERFGKSLGLWAGVGLMGLVMLI